MIELCYTLITTPLRQPPETTTVFLHMLGYVSSLLWFSDDFLHVFSKAKSILLRQTFTNIY